MKDDACVCLTCDGVGFVGTSEISGWECEDCSGTGRVPVYQEALDEIELVEECVAQDAALADLLRRRHYSQEGSLRNLQLPLLFEEVE